MNRGRVFDPAVFSSIVNHVNGDMSQDINRFITDSIEYARDAWREFGGEERYYCFGPVTLCVRHIGAALVDTVSPAIRHAMVSKQSSVNGTVYALDAKSLHLRRPPETWPFSTNTYQEHQRIYWDTESGLALNSDESRGIWQLFNLHNCDGLYWVDDETTLPSWEAGSPLRIFLHWLTWNNNCQLIHAAGLEWQGRGILLTGPGGSGKSTTTAAAVGAGWNMVGDDFVLVSDGCKPVAHCIYDTIKLTRESLGKLPNIADSAINAPVDAVEKFRVHLSDRYRQRLVGKIAIDTLFTLNIAGAHKTCILPASKASVMAALAPTTMFMLKMGMKESFHKMTGLVNQMQCYSVQMSTDPCEVAASMARFVENPET